MNNPYLNQPWEPEEGAAERYPTADAFHVEGQSAGHWRPGMVAENQYYGHNGLAYGPVERAIYNAVERIVVWYRGDGE